MATMPLYGKNTLKSSFRDLMNFRMKHQRPKSFIICANYDPGLILTYFTARLNFSTEAFTWENATMMDSLVIIASCDILGPDIR